MDIILSMTLSGSLVFIVYRFFNCIKFLPLSLQNRYMIVKFILFFHFVPLGYLFAIWLKPFCLKHRLASGYTFIDCSKPLIVSWPNRYYMNPAYIHHLMLISIWLLFSLAFFLSSVFARIKLRRQILDFCEEITSEAVLTIQSRCQALLGIKKNIPIYWSGIHTSAFTYGIFRQIIIVPKSYDMEEIELAVLHELIHIKRKDSFILFLRFLAMGMYWFNPLMFLIYRETDKLCELTCDEFVIDNIKEENRRCYSRLIITATTNECNLLARHVTAFSKNQTIIKERIDLIMKEKKRNCNKYPLASLILSTGIILCGVFPALAYELPQEIRWFDAPEKGFSTASFIEFSEIGHEEQQKSWEPIEQIIYDSQFTDIYGNVYPVDDIEKRANCNHSFVQGTYTTHTQNGKDGCVIKNYSALRCSQCGEMKNKILINKNEYTICPH